MENNNDFELNNPAPAPIPEPIAEKVTAIIIPM